MTEEQKDKYIPWEYAQLPEDAKAIVRDLKRIADGKNLYDLRKH